MDDNDILRSEGSTALDPERDLKKAEAGAASSSAETLPLEIHIGTDEQRVNDEAVQALASAPQLYQRAGHLVRVIKESSIPGAIRRPAGAPRIDIIPLATLRETLSSVARWIKHTKDGPKDAHPPTWSVSAVESRKYWPGVPHLEGVVEHPVLRPDGSVLDCGGYDPVTGLMLLPNARFLAVPLRPTAADVKTSLELLLDVVCDFPFADDVHQSAWLAALLAPFARFAFEGCAPLTLIDGNIRGVGKGLLFDTVGLTAAGRDVARMTNPRDDEECRKRVTALALAADPMVLIDNVSGPLGCPSLDAALTATTWSDRILGRSQTTGTLPLHMLWYATGNNVELRGDTARRVMHVRIESLEETPEQREGFKHPKLREWILAHRPELVRAALTLLRGFELAGRPDHGGRAWGSFEEWSALVRGAVVWVGLPDPYEAHDTLVDQSEPELTALRGLLLAWEELDPDGHGMTAEDALRKSFAEPSASERAKDALTELVPTRDGSRPTARRLGKQLGHFRRRVVDGRFIEPGSTSVRGAKVWFVRQAGARL